MELRIHPALHDAELRVFSSRASSLCHSTCVRMWGERSRPHDNSSKQQHSRLKSLRDRRRRSAWPLAVIYLFPSRLLAC